MRIAAALALSLAACAPITTYVVPATGRCASRRCRPGGRRRLAGLGAASGDGFSVAMSGRRSCRAITVRTVRRTDHLQRSADGAVQGITYGLAVLLGALGGFLYYDNRSGVAAGDRLWDGSFSPTAGRVTGISLGAMGVVELTVGIIDSIRARDGKRAPRELELRDEDGTASMACGDADAGAVQISAAAEGQRPPFPWARPTLTGSSRCRGARFRTRSSAAAAGRGRSGSTRAWARPGSRWAASPRKPGAVPRAPGLARRRDHEQPGGLRTGGRELPRAAG